MIEAGAPVAVQPVAAVSAASVATPAAAEIDARVEPIHEPDYAARRGYDPDFLGVRIPEPLPRDGSVAAQMSDGKIEIPYHHFSILMHEERRLALITAATSMQVPP